MTYAWELICHHTYAGIPGVIADISPGAGSHGLAYGLSDSDYLTDGVERGSGAVRFYKTGAGIHVVPGKSWAPLGGIMAEVTLRCQPSPWPLVHTLFDSDSFQLTLRQDNLGAWFCGTPLSYSQVDAYFDAVGGQPYSVAHGAWVRLGFLHDGLNRMELYVNGRLIAKKDGPLNGVASLGGNGLYIGNSRTGDTFLNGDIDEVKIWRHDPAHADRAFFNRPWDEQTAECWVEFLRSIQAALQKYPDCAALLRRSVMDCQARLRRITVGNGPQTRDRFYHSSAEYQSLWTAGAIDTAKMAKLFSDWVTWLRLVGITIENDPGMAALKASDCWRLIVGELKSTDCDPKIRPLLKHIMKDLRPEYGDAK